MKKTITACLLLLSVLAPHRAEAQSPQAAPPQAASPDQQRPAEDPLGRSTPHGAAIGLIQAVEQRNLDRAAEYLESGLPLSARRELAQKLWTVLDRRLVAGMGRLSNRPDGNLEDGLTNRDRIGLIESPSGTVDVFVDRVQRGRNDPIWLFPSTLLEEIPRLYDEIQPPWIERYVPERLRSTRWLFLPLYQWIGLVLVIPLIFGVAALSTRALTDVLRRLFQRIAPDQDQSALASVGPLRLLVLAVCFYGASFIGLSLAGRQFSRRVAETVMVMGLCWLSMRLMDVLAQASLRRLDRVHRSADTAVVRLINRLSKAAAVIVAVLVLLYLADVDLTAALTGLGVGGIAIGFGAQKTIENLFGGIMVISDKPIKVGDVCKAGEFMGTVEDIGIRSTRIRTMNRTVVAVPNGLLSSMSLENFTQRDQIPFQHTVGLIRDTTADQLRLVLPRVRHLLDAHPKIVPTSARARFVRFTAASLELEIFAYVREREQAAFLAVQEDLLLAIMDILAASGTSIAPAATAPPAPSPAAR